MRATRRRYKVAGSVRAGSREYVALWEAVMVAYECGGEVKRADGGELTPREYYAMAYALNVIEGEIEQ